MISRSKQTTFNCINEFANNILINIHYCIKKKKSENIIFLIAYKGKASC